MARVRFLLVVRWLAAGFLFGIAAPALAQAGLVGAPIPVCVARDAGGVDLAAILSPRAALDCIAPQPHLGPGDFWVRSGPLAIHGPVDVRVVSLWQRRATLYAHYADGTLVRHVIDEQGASRRMQLGAVILQSLPARAAALDRLVWHVEGSANLRGVLIGARLARPAESARSNLLMGALYAAFVGLAAGLLVYNLALWGALRHRFQLVYCAMLAGLIVYACSSSGFLAWLWPAIANNDRMRVNYLSLAASAAAAMLFARDFFEPRVFAGWLARLSCVVSAAMMATATLYAVVAPWHIGLLDALYAWTFAAQVAIIGPVLWRGWRMRSNYLWMFALGWSAPIALAALRVLAAIRLARWSFWLDNSTLVSMAIEALLSSVAIAYRIKLLSRERDVAREQEIAARALADLDPLTGLLNRRAFLAQAIGRPGDHMLLIADIDHFKAVNDTIGHDGGDEVLRLFARTLRQALPAEALVARIGGEEFAMIVPASRPVEPDMILARLRARAMPFDLTVTASIGSCIGPLATERDWKAMYRGADRALFDAKSAGRDRARQVELHAQAA